MVNYYDRRVNRRNRQRRRRRRNIIDHYREWTPQGLGPIIWQYAGGSLADQTRTLRHNPNRINIYNPNHRNPTTNTRGPNRLNPNPNTRPGHPNMQLRRIIYNPLRDNPITMSFAGAIPPRRQRRQLGILESFMNSM